MIRGSGLNGNQCLRWVRFRRKSTTLEREEQARAAFGVTGNLTISSHSQYAEPSNAVTPDPRTFKTKQGALQFNQPIYKPTLIAQLQQSKAQSEQARDALRYLRVKRESTAAQVAQAKRSFTVGTVAITDVRDA